MARRKALVCQGENNPLIAYQPRNPTRLVSVANRYGTTLMGLDESLLARKCTVFILINQGVKYFGWGRRQGDHLVDIFGLKFHALQC
jgi:hypothetical protein